LLLLLFVSTIAFSQNTAIQTPQDGFYKGFYANKTIKEKGHYKQGLKQGIWYYYSELGVMEKKEKYKLGELQWQLFFEKGKLTKIIDKKGKVTERSKCGC
jgi:antitoxin component YwqK of YwqJK toxin-antitoxin module